MTRPLRVLIVEDNPFDAELILHALRRAGYDPRAACVETEQEYREQLRHLPEVILADFTLPKFGAVRALEIMKAAAAEIPFIVVSGTIGDEVAVEIMQRGASDYILKDRLGRLGQAVARAIERQAIAVAAMQARETNEERLRRSEQRYRTLVAATTSIVWDSPPSGAFDTDQPAWTTFTGQSVEEHRGWGWLDAIHPDDREKSRTAWFEAVNSVGIYRMEHRVRRSDGEYRLMTARAVPILEGDGTIREWVGIHTDVTDQRRVEDALQSHEAKLAEAAKLARLGYWTRDLASGRIEWSDLLYDIFGVDPQTFEHTFESFLALLHPGDRQAERERIEAAVSRVGSFDHSYRVVVRGETRVIHEVGRVVADPDGRAVQIVGTAQDITERTRAEEVIRRTSALLQAVADGTTDAVYVKDREGKYQFFNRAAARFVDRPVEDVLGRDDTALYDPISARRIIERGRSVMESGRAGTSEEILTAAGVTRTYQTTEAPQWDSAGNVIGLIGIARDITAKLQIETERAELLNQLNLQIERMPLAYLLSGPDFRYTRWNPAAERMFGFSEADVLGKLPFETIIPPQTADFATAIFARLAAGDMNAHGTTENITKAGRTIACEWHNTPLFGSDGTFHGILSLGHDVTARRDDERSLRMRDRAIQAVTQGILITDELQADHPISYVSPGFVRLTGYASDEAIGRNCRFLQGKDTDPATVARLHDLLQAGEPGSVELLNYRKDGTAFWNELSISPVRDAHERVIHFVGVQTDVTSRRSLEEKFLQAQKMDAFGQLAGGVAHDFNNLLTIINGYSDMLLENLPMEDESRELVVEIRAAGERSAGLTRQLLAFSRQQVLAPRVLNLNTVVSDTEKMFRRLIGEDIQSSRKLADDLWAVRADPGQIEQVLMNLVVNARDAMPVGGRVTIETRNVELDETYARTHPEIRPGQHVLLSVADTGGGIPPEVMARIFEPFFTTKAKGKGTGLGLATVFGIIKQSGGHVAVYSEVGVGTTFKIYLPRVERNAGVARDVSVRPTNPTGTETILLVEDDPGVRLLTGRMLTGLGYAVMEASGGVDANRLAGEYPGPIQLLVTDVVMPGLSGRQVAEQVIGLHPEVKVLFVSGYTDDAIFRHGILEEKVHFLPKPFTPRALAQKVREVLDSPFTGGGIIVEAVQE